MRTKEQYEVSKNLHEVQGKINFTLDVFGDYIAEREGYKVHQGIEAIHFYLIQKYSWTPATVHHLSPEDIDFLLKEEMHGWTLPKEAKNL